MTALIFICTGASYWKYLQPAIDSANRFFPADILLFTDSPNRHSVAKQVQIPHAGWPYVTLMRYHQFLTQYEWLCKYDHIFYLDCDMTVVGQVGDEILCSGITGTVHASFAARPKSTWTPEEDSRSTACLLRTDIRRYYTGCFFGGKTGPFITMCQTLRWNIDKDNANDFIATWHDESHLNRYLYDHPPVFELGTDYNAWRKTPSTKIMRVDKRDADGIWHNYPAVNGRQP